VDVAAYSKFLLALVIWREASGEGEVGMLAVGHVIANRVFHWSRSWHDVILGQNQFSSMTIKGDGQTVKYPALGDPVFDIAESVYAGFSRDNTGGALYYANEEVVGVGWYRDHIILSPEHLVTVIIGRHTFRV
jgi:spore germination cell wall hydrolase CwlJ-like protein